MKQGDVYWYTFPAPNKRRPVLILTRDSAIHYLTGITVAAITSKIRGIDSEVRLSRFDGFVTECAASLDNIHTIPKAKLGPFIAHLSRERMVEVRRAIEFALGFDAIP